MQTKHLGSNRTGVPDHRQLCGQWASGSWLDVRPGMKKWRSLSSAAHQLTDSNTPTSEGFPPLPFSPLLFHLLSPPLPSHPLSSPPLPFRLLSPPLISLSLPSFLHSHLECSFGRPLWVNLALLVAAHLSILGTVGKRCNFRHFLTYGLKRRSSGRGE